MLIPPTRSERNSVAAGVGPRRKHNREVRRQALLRAATELFAAQGFDRTTTREISSRAGCAEGLIHRYFQGKDGLLQALLEAESETVSTQQPESLPAGGDLEEGICRLLEVEIDSLWRHREFLCVTVPKAVLDPAMGNHLHRVLGPDRRKNAIRRSLLELQPDGLLGEDEINSLAETIATLCLGLVLARQLIFGAGSGETRSLAATMARTLCTGMPRSPQIASVIAANNENSGVF